MVSKAMTIRLINKTPSLAEAKKVLATATKNAITISKREGEFRVNFRNGGESTAYYTTDIIDAIDTGFDMDQRNREAVK